MAYDGARPANDDYISAGPALIRENQRALKEDGIGNAGTLVGKVPGNASGNIPISNGVLCSNLHADKLDGKDASDFAGAAHGHNVATTNDNGFMSNTDKQKLDGIQSGAQVNGNTYGRIFIGSGNDAGKDIGAGVPGDVFTFYQGANIGLRGNVAARWLAIDVTGVVPNASYANNAGNASSLQGYGPGNFAAAGHTMHPNEISSLTTQGYRVFADGFKIQFFHTGPFALNETRYLFFPIAFSTRPFAFFARPEMFFDDKSKFSYPALSTTQIALKCIGAACNGGYCLAIGK